LGGSDTGPNFDAGAVRGVVHADVVDVDVFNDVDFGWILAQAADGDAVATVAPQVLNEDFGAVGFEGNAVVTVIDVAILDNDVAASILGS
jgi:hypothetical protein